MKATLTKRRVLPNGKVEAVHAWDTGYQVLEFDSLTDFNLAKSKFNTATKGA